MLKQLVPFPSHLKLNDVDNACVHSSPFVSTSYIMLSSYCSAYTSICGCTHTTTLEEKASIQALGEEKMSIKES